jgi:cell wall assembly regulator SMI1
MTSLWTCFETALKTKAPELLAALNPPASEASLNLLQDRLKCTLPADVLTCLRCHDGQQADTQPLFGPWAFLSCESIFDAWSFWKKQSERSDFNQEDTEPDAGVRAGWWNPQWIPFATNGSGDYLCLDLAPTGNGSVGQIITLWHDDGARKIEAQSFARWLSHFY